MRDERLKVLQELLARPIERESEVVYFLVEVRKLIECLEARYPILTFFCDWIVHNRLDRRTAKEILSEFDQFVATMLANGGRVTEAMMARIRPLISFMRFRDDLLLMLGEHGLDTTLISDLGRWGTFFGLYVDIIAKTPLVADNRHLALKHVNNIAVLKYTRSLESTPTQGESFVFGIRWKLMYGETELLSLANEIFFPHTPKRVRVTVAKAVNRDGIMTLVPLESQNLWN